MKKQLILIFVLTLFLAGCAGQMPTDPEIHALAVRGTEQALLRGEVELQLTRAAADLERQSAPARGQATAAVLLAQAETAVTRANFTLLMQLAGCVVGVGLMYVLWMALHAYLQARVAILRLRALGGPVMRSRPESYAPVIDYRMPQGQKDALRLLARAIRLAPEGSEDTLIPSDDVLRVSRHEREEVVGLLERAGAVRVYPSVGTYIDERYQTLGGLYAAVKDGKIPLP